MRIGIDARFLQGPKRGQGQYIYYLIKELLELGEGNEVVAFYNSLKTGEFAFDKKTPRLKQVWCNIPGTFFRKTWPRFQFPPIEHMVGNVDIFHNAANFSFVHYSPIPCRAPMVATFNGMPDPTTLWHSFDPRKIEAWFVELAKRASIVITVSQIAKKDLMIRSSIPEEKIRIIHYGVSEDFLPVSDKRDVNKALSKYGLAGKRYVLYAGGAEPNKNLETLLNVFSNISKKDGMKDLHLVLAGKIDNFYHSLVGKVEALGMAQKVVFTDYIGHDDLPLIYNGAEVFISPAHVEPFGIPVLEAIACGVPTVVSTSTGALDVAGDSVISFDPKDPKSMTDALIAVLTNKDLRASLVAKGLERAKAMTWKEMARKTLAVYKEVHAKTKR